MPFPILAVRPTPPAALVGAIVATFGLIWVGNAVMSAHRPTVTAIHTATGGWLNENLLLFAPLTVLVVGVFVMGWGRQRPRDLGLPLRPGAALGLLAIGWLTLQLMAATLAIATGQGLALHPVWERHGPGTILGYALAMLLGTALFEEIVFRGYLLPQLCLRLGGVRHPGWRVGLAATMSSVLFAGFHLPTLVLNQSLSGGALASTLAGLFAAGLLLCLLYLRTGHLAIGVGVHALVNAPTLVVATPVSGSVLAMGLGLAAIGLGPRLVNEPWSSALLRFEARP